MRRQNQGFTVIELLVASSVALILLLFVGNILSSVLKIQAREDQNFFLIDQAQLIMVQA